MPIMHQLLISVVLRDPSDDPNAFEHYARATAMDLGERMMHDGAPVHMVSAAHSPIAVDPRQLGLREAIQDLQPQDVEFLMSRCPKIWLSLMMLVGMNEENHNVPTPEAPV